MRYRLPNPTLGNPEMPVEELYGSLLSPLHLSADPTQPLQAATKRYVDNKKAGDFDAGYLTSGTLDISHFPEIIGDIQSPQGSGVLSIRSDLFIPGVYVKPTVLANGLVSGSAGPLLDSDIPLFNWSKITATPLSLSGYGITDALPKVGGAMTNYISVMNQPAQALSICPRNYVDAKIEASGSMKSGSIVGYASEQTPFGFLRCNGAQVSQTTYASLYAIIGNTFTPQITNYVDSPWYNQNTINTQGPASLGGWTLSTAMDTARDAAHLVVTKNRVYIASGMDQVGAFPSTMSVGVIASDGSISSWLTTPTVTPSRYGGGIVIAKGYAFLLGGYNGSTYVKTVHKAVVNADGSLGAWVQTTDLPQEMFEASYVVYQDKLYLIAGRDIVDNRISTIRYATINNDGTLGAWTVCGSLPGPTMNGQVVFTLGTYIYLIGGFDGTTVYSTIYRGVIATDGSIGNWTNVGNYPTNISNARHYLTSNRLFVLGGYTGAGYASAIYSCPVQVDNTLGSWMSNPANKGDNTVSQCLFATSGYLYLVGGSLNDTATSNVWLTPLTGGLSDYSNYYNGGTVTPIAGQFFLPDYTNKESSYFKYYIKT